MSLFKYRELGRLMKERRGHELTLAVPLPTSPKGMNNLRCPSEVCQPRVFQLGEGSSASGESDPRSRRAPGQPLATCPYCGHDDDQKAFFHPDDIEAIKEEVLWAASRDVGHALEDMARGFNRRFVTALETYLKTAYRFLVRKRYSTPEALQFCSKKAIQNSFQNIERGQRLFRQRLNIDPFGHLEPSALERLHVNLEKRHLIGHNLGLIDDTYLQSVGAEAIGSNVPLVAEEVTAFAEVASSVITRLETQPEFQPASAS